MHPPISEVLGGGSGGGTGKRRRETRVRVAVVQVPAAAVVVGDGRARGEAIQQMVEHPDPLVFGAGVNDVLPPE